MSIGIIPVRHQQTILVGQHQKAINLSTTHVQPVGVFPTVETMVFGADQTIWYPASGFRYSCDGSLDDVGLVGRSWSASPDSNLAYD